MVVAKLGSEYVGTAVVLGLLCSAPEIEERLIHALQVFVKSKHRSLGLGRKLVAQLTTPNLLGQSGGTDKGQFYQRIGVSTDWR